jgi:nucleoside phosphorylase
LRRSRCALENLEAFALARAAASLRIPFAVVLGITNTVGPPGHREWQQNAVAAAGAACRAVLAFLNRHE